MVPPQIPANSEHANLSEESVELFPIAEITSAYSLPSLAITDALLSL